MLNMIIILFTLKILKIPIKNKILRLSVSCILITTAECALLLIIHSYSLYKWFSLLFICPFAVLLFTGRAINIIRVWIITIFVTILMGGAVYAVDSLVSDRFTLNCLICVIIIYALLDVWLDNIKRQKNIYNVTVYERGKSIAVRGLYDSGNMLKKQPENRPVHIGSDKIFSIIDENKEFCEIPYKSLGNEMGVTEGCCFEKLVIEYGREKKEFNNVLIARASENLLNNMAYDMILNEAVFDDAKGMEHHIAG